MEAGTSRFSSLPFWLLRLARTGSCESWTVESADVAVERAEDLSAPLPKRGLLSRFAVDPRCEVLKGERSDLHQHFI